MEAKITKQFLLIGIILVLFSTGLHINIDKNKNYYYANGKKIFVKEIPQKRVIKLKSNTQKEITTKSVKLRQLHPKSFFYNVDFLGSAASDSTESIKNYINQSIIELPVYKENKSGDELIISDDYIVSFKKNIKRKDIENIIENKLNSEIISQLNYVLDGAGFHLKLRKPIDNVISISNKCIENGWCNWAHPNFIRRIYLNSTPSDTFFSQQWHLKTINVEQAWDITRGNPDITIAIIDDGFDWDHEEFNIPEKVVKRFNLVEGGNDTRLIPATADLDTVLNTVKSSAPLNHGTSVGGLAAASDNGKGVVGVCPRCMIMPIKIAIDSNVGGSKTFNFFLVQSSVAASAIIKATDEGADIINCSWGSSVLADNVRSAIDYANQKGRNGKGSIVVFAAGNGIPESCKSSSISGVAQYEPVITVGSTNMSDTMSSFSSTGAEVDVVAPGGDCSGDIVTTDSTGVLGYSPRRATDALKLTLLGSNRIWKLEVSDEDPNVTGTLNSWSLEFVNLNNKNSVFESPSMSVEIPDGPKGDNDPVQTITSFNQPSLTNLSQIVSPVGNGLPLIKDILLNLDIQHGRGDDLEANVTDPLNTFLNLMDLSPDSFPTSAPFIPFTGFSLEKASSLPEFDLDTDGDFTNSFNGTSASAPIVSGLVGLIISINPELTFKEVDQILKETADKVDKAGGDYNKKGRSNIYGFGRVNAFSAVQRARDFNIVIAPTPTPELSPNSSPEATPSAGPTSKATSTPKPTSTPRENECRYVCQGDTFVGVVSNCNPGLECKSQDIKCSGLTVSTTCENIVNVVSSSSGGGGNVTPPPDIDLLPSGGVEKNSFNLLVRGSNFVSQGNCQITTSGLKAVVEPAEFTLSSQNNETTIKITIPRKVFKKFRRGKQLTVNVSCSNNANASSNIIISK